MYSSINNLNKMKVNFRNRKILLNFPKDGSHKLAEHKQSSTADNYRKPSSQMNNAIKESSSNLIDRLQMHGSKQSYIDSIADTIHLIGQEYIEYLNEGKQERFRAAILSSLTKLEARDRKIIIEYAFEYNAQNQPEFNFSKQEQKFKEWLGEVHFKIVSTSFDFQINKLLTFPEVKVYCSENLLLNIVLFIQKVQNRINGILLQDFMAFINKTLDDNLQYLMIKYPQAKQIKPNKRLRQQVQPINNMENDINDILQYSGLKFELNQSQNYNSQIMRFINYIIEIMTQETEIYGQKYPFAEGFSQIMENLFQSTYIPQTEYQKLKNKNLKLQQYKKEVAILFETNKEVKDYREKVSKYSSYKIGTKINPNTELYSEAEIKAGFFEVKSTSILRILTKWIEELEKKIFEAKEYIQKRSFRFKNLRGSFSKLNASQKNDLYLQATKQIQKLRKFIKNIRSNAFSIQGQLAMTMKRNKNQINIPKHEYMVGQFSTKLQDAASSSLLSYLNQIIHILLLIPHNSKSKYAHDEELLKQMQIDLITFKISDLLRCKFSSHENQILRAYREIKRLSDDSDFFKIVRIKDRLELGTRDILINVSYKGKILCQVQLAVTDEIDTKQQAFDAFNHYLYQLKRSNLGPIMESACIWAHFDQRSRIYKKIKEKQIQDYYLNGVVKRVVHNCKEQLVDNDLPFVCTICQKFYFSQQGIIKHKRCLKCQKFYHCSLCLQNKMQEEQLKLFLGLNISLGVFVQDFAQWDKNQDAIDYPRHGLIIPKKNKKVQIYFFTTVLWKEDAYIVRTVEVDDKNPNKVEVVMVVKNNELRQWKKLKENYILYEWKETRKVNSTIKPASILEEQQKQRRKKEEEQAYKKMKKQKQIQEVKDKWRKMAKIKNKDNEKGQQSRPGSAQSNESKQSKRSKDSKGSKTSSRHSIQKNEEGNTKTRKGEQPTVLIEPMPVIQQQRTFYLQKIAKRSTINEFKVATKITKNQDQQTLTYHLVLGPYYKQKQIRAELKKINNYKVIRQLLERKMQVLSMEDMLIEDQLNLDEKEIEKFSNSLSKVSEIYLDYNVINDIDFLQKMPRISVVHLNYNMVGDMDSFEKLTELTQLMLQYNRIYDVKGLQNKNKLVQVNLNHNYIETIQGLQQVPNLQILTFANNRIQEIKGLEKLTSLKKLDLSYNKIEQIKGLQNLVNLQELDLSDNLIPKIVNLEKLVKLKKLNLYKNRINKIEGLQTLTQLKYLDLHHNLIPRIQNLENLKKLIILNLGGNRIKKIEGLKLMQIIVELNLSQNSIMTLKPLIDSNLNNLKTLDISYNGIRKLLPEIIQFLPKLEKMFVNSNPIKMTKKQTEIHKKLFDEFRKRSGFCFAFFSDENQNIDTESDYENQQEQKLKRIAKLETKQSINFHDQSS